MIAEPIQRSMPVGPSGIALDIAIKAPGVVASDSPFACSAEQLVDKPRPAVLSPHSPTAPSPHPSRVRGTAPRFPALRRRPPTPQESPARASAPTVATNRRRACARLPDPPVHPSPPGAAAAALAASPLATPHPPLQLSPTRVTSPPGPPAVPDLRETPGPTDAKVATPFRRLSLRRLLLPAVGRRRRGVHHPDLRAGRLFLGADGRSDPSASSYLYCLRSPAPPGCPPWQSRHHRRGLHRQPGSTTSGRNAGGVVQRCPVIVLTGITDA